MAFPYNEVPREPEDHEKVGSVGCLVNVIWVIHGSVHLDRPTCPSRGGGGWLGPLGRERENWHTMTREKGGKADPCPTAECRQECRLFAGARDFASSARHHRMPRVPTACRSPRVSDTGSIYSL